MTYGEMKDISKEAASIALLCVTSAAIGLLAFFVYECSEAVTWYW